MLLPCANGSKQDIPTPAEQRASDVRFGFMDAAPEKLRALARQARALSARTIDRQRAHALEALARLYERQAHEVDALELA
jgi:hypothetical protein